MNSFSMGVLGFVREGEGEHPLWLPVVSGKLESVVGGAGMNKNLPLWPVTLIP